MLPEQKAFVQCSFGGHVRPMLIVFSNFALLSLPVAWLSVALFRIVIRSRLVQWQRVLLDRRSPPCAAERL